MRSCVCTCVHACVRVEAPNVFLRSTHSVLSMEGRSHLDAYFIGMGNIDFYLFDHQRLVGLPGHSSLTLNNLEETNIH